MEKRIAEPTDKNLKKIVITGPESTGKTQLCENLARLFCTVWVPEYAREYVEKLDERYDYHDVENIGRKQVAQLTGTYHDARSYVFFDTGLIITKIWFLECYRKCPSFIDKAIREITVDMYLLCYPDIKWIRDPVRENRGENRERLFSLYEDELIRLGATYSIIEGEGDSRLNRAVHEIERKFGKD